MPSLRILALLPALLLAGCVVVPPAPTPAPQTGGAPVQLECGVSSPPGCREPTAFAAFQAKTKAEIETADRLRQKAVDAMATLPDKLRIDDSETVTTEQMFRSNQTHRSRSLKVLDAVVLDLPWAAKSLSEHKQAMNAVKDIATLMADNRGKATIYVTVAPADLRAKKVNLKSGTAPTEAGNPVEVKKSVDKNVPAGIEHFVIQAAPWPSTID